MGNKDVAAFIAEKELALVELPGGGEPSDLNMAQQVAEVLGYEPKFVYFEDEIKKYVVELNPFKSKKPTVITHKREENNANDAIKRLEDAGHTMATQTEVEELKQELSDMKKLLSNTGLRQEDMSNRELLEYLKNQNEKQKEEDFNKKSALHAEHFRNELKRYGRVSVWVSKRKNAKGETADARIFPQIKFNERGGLEMDGSGRPIVFEEMVVTLNGVTRRYSLGQKISQSLGSFDPNVIWLHDVEFPFAMVIAEAFPQSIVCPKTGESFYPRAKDTAGIHHVFTDPSMDGKIYSSGISY